MSNIQLAAQPVAKSKGLSKKYLATDITYKYFIDPRNSTSTNSVYKSDAPSVPTVSAMGNGFSRKRRRVPWNRLAAPAVASKSKSRTVDQSKVPSFKQDN